MFGPYWAWIDEACAQWPVMSADRYTGPWNHPTAAPILVVGNTVDPATPYANAVAMSHDLANARLLTVDGYGHSALTNPSSCVAAAEDSYFVTGTLPARHRVPPECAPVRRADTALTPAQYRPPLPLSIGCCRHRHEGP